MPDSLALSITSIINFSNFKFDFLEAANVITIAYTTATSSLNPPADFKPKWIFDVTMSPISSLNKSFIIAEIVLLIAESYEFLISTRTPSQSKIIESKFLYFLNHIIRNVKFFGHSIRSRIASKNLEFISGVPIVTRKHPLCDASLPNFLIEIPCSISALYTRVSAPLASNNTKFALESKTSKASYFFKFCIILALCFLITSKIGIICFDFSIAKIPHSIASVFSGMDIV